MWAYFASYAEAMRDVLGLKGLDCWEKYQAWEDCAREGGFRILHEEFCIVSNFPEVLKTLPGGMPHCATGPSHRWRDGFEIYHLNGVRVPKALVMTPAEKLDPKMIFTEENAEIRREIVRKIGMEKIILKCGAKVLDKKWDYELLEFDIGDGRKRPYLKMRNPSIATWHIEGVSPGTKTVDEALQFRKPSAMAKIPVSENGQEWYQQGDVCVWPQDAKFLKPYPEILT